MNNKNNLIDFSTSINPLGFPECVRRVMSRNVEKLRYYPDPDGADFLAIIGHKLGVDRQNLLLGNGSTEILYALPRALGYKRAVIPVPASNDYTAACRLAGLEIESLGLQEAAGFRLDLAELGSLLRGSEIVFIGQPSNPTGSSVPRDQLLDLIDAFPETFFVIDESFAEFMPEYLSVAQHGAENFFMLRSLSHFYAFPGLRIGFGHGSAEIIHRLKKYLAPGSVNTMALAVGCAALQDKRFGTRSRDVVALLREKLSGTLSRFSEFTVYPSDANFLLIRIDKEELTCAGLAEKLSWEGIAIGLCDHFDGLAARGAKFFRLAIRNEEDNDKLLQALEKILRHRPVPARGRKKFSLMLQGTASNAGKSVLTAALCRILIQDGFRVAPFKSQNMSLNSYVTHDGLEMGRAQVVQAQACRLDPDVRMNPVLLKPSSDVGSQVIINGRLVGNMLVDDYVAYKPKAWEAVCVAYDSLQEEYNGVILEGAGSPGEVNLKHHDIVNMRMAQYARSPVLLAGDIDRGGVFASFVGTMEVLAEWERALVAGFIVNRFRGKESLLGNAFRYVEEHTGRPVFGVVPYLRQLGLPEEDSVSFKAGLYDSPTPAGDYVEIGLIDLPHISNFTDYEPFLAEPDVHLRIIRQVADLEAVQGTLSAIFLPGSKNVIADMEYLVSSGLADLIRFLAQSCEVEVAGICGGFQMLGQRINDPHGLESHGRGGSGLGLLDMTTTLAADKTLKRLVATHVQSGIEVHGYEIHHGTTMANHKALLDHGDEQTGALSENGMIWGSYLHGIFDDDLFRRWFIDGQRKRQGLKPTGKVLAVYDLEPAFDRLADTVRQGLNMKEIYKLLGV